MIESLGITRKPANQAIRWATLVTVMTMQLCGAAFADTARHYRIPAQPLEDALMQFATDTNLRLLFAADQVRGMSANGIDGSMTQAQALSRLLQGSGMAYRFVDAGTVTIEPSSNFKKTAVVDEKPQSNNETGSETTLEKVTVEADAAYDPEYYADPYNKDYVLPNATVGTKTDTPIMETPLNVQVISKQVLKEQQVIRLDQALKNVSGVTTNTNSSTFGSLGDRQQAIFLRGFESSAHFRNGFRLQQGAGSRELANVESVEVLKGPAAILYGLVEPGGMVNVVTKKPLATPYYGFTQQFGSYDLYRSTFDAGGPLSKNKDILYRANLSYENSGSFREFVGNEDVFFAPALIWKISPKTQVTFDLEYSHQHQGLDFGFFPAIVNPPIGRNFGEYSPATTETIFGSINWSHQFNDDWSIKHWFSVNQRTRDALVVFPEQGLLGNKTFLRNNTDNDPNINLIPDTLLVGRDRFASSGQNDTYSTNLDLTGHFDTFGLKHTLLLGGDYYRLDDKGLFGGSVNPTLSYIGLINPVHPGSNPFGPIEYYSKEDNNTDQYGLYFQDQIKLPYDFHVTGGIRYQYIHQNNFSQFIGSSASPPERSGQTQDAVTPRVGLLWHPKSWVSLYANYVESFGANSGLVWPNRSAVPPTSAAQYEGGIKFELFDGKLRANLAYFDLTKTNVAVSDPVHLVECGGPCSLALGAVRSRGPELDITGEILPGWNVVATWANTDIIVTKTDANNTPIITRVGTTYEVGGRLPNVPRNTGRLWSSYEVQGGDYKGLTFGGGINLADNRLGFDPFVGHPTKIPGYATVDLMAGYSRNLGDVKASVQLNVNNLLDKRYFSSVNGAYVDFGQPRTFMGQVSLQY